jgi:radical SAM superfamily enzyme YgiQ (UPF0313 family)
MKLALIAMSGIRAENAELAELGMTLPGFLERTQALFAMPSLSLLTLAGIVPDTVELEYREYREFPCAEPPECDLAAITSFTAQIEDAYRLAAIYRKRGTKVVMGGLHVSKMPEEAAAHCDAICVGEGEPLWPRILEDFCAGRLQPRYEGPWNLGFDLSNAPMPRYDLLDATQYNRFPVQTSRGCPFKCEFCASSIMLTPRYVHKPVERVIEEIREIKNRWPSPLIEFADDNTFADPHYGRRLTEAVALQDVKWFAETDISIAWDKELLRQLAPSGCRQILIGLESPTASGLNGLELRSNWKYRKRDYYREAIERIQSHGITVNGCFVLGLDGDTEEAFDLIPAFVEETAMYDVQITVQTAFPGTPLYHRLAQAGRLIEPCNWRKCTLFDVNYLPLQMTPEQLECRFYELAGILYSQGAVTARHRRFVEVYGSTRNGMRGQKKRSHIEQPLPVESESNGVRPSRDVM